MSGNLVIEENGCLVKRTVRSDATGGRPSALLCGWDYLSLLQRHGGVDLRSACE